MSGPMTFPRNYSLFRNKTKTKAIDFNPKCIFFFFPYKRGQHTHCVYSTESVRFYYTTCQFKCIWSRQKLVANMCDTTQQEVLLSSTTLIYLKKIQKRFRPP